MDTWRGHFPITHFVRHALVRKQGQVGMNGLSRAEHVLFTACQFWAAVARRDLSRYLASECTRRLVVAFEAYSEIGAVRTASALRVVIAQCPDEPSPAWLLQNIPEMEGRLLDTEDPIDHLVAQFASAHFTDRSTENQRVRVKTGL